MRYVVLLCILFIIGGGVVISLKTSQQDTQCIKTHITTNKPPTQVTTAQDYFDQGNYDYDIGDCLKAIVDYTQALQANPNFAEAYNNRAYTYMRMHQYSKALPDLDAAIQIRPAYVNALMNRGDIYNYYYLKDKQKALADYDTVLSLGPDVYKTTSLCGHRLLAQNNGWTVQTLYQLITRGEKAGCE